MKENEPQLIDRLVLGRPPRAQMEKRLFELVGAGWTHAEIGALYGVSGNTVSVQLSRARRRLTLTVNSVRFTIADSDTEPTR